MTTATAAIAQHLNVTESIIAKVEEWAHVLFVRFIGRRPRFVSKKVVEMDNAHIAGFKTEIESKKARLAEATTEAKQARLGKVVARMESELVWMTKLPEAVFARLGKATTSASLVDDLRFAVCEYELATGNLLPRP